MVTRWVSAAWAARHSLSLCTGFAAGPGASTFYYYLLLVLRPGHTYLLLGTGPATPAFYY